jgi:hypothetical protein
MTPAIQNITNGNEAVPNEISGETASKIAEYMRMGMSSKDAYVKGLYDNMVARAKKRGVYTGWKKYDQSSDMGDAETLNADCAGTGWCTGGSVGTANSHLSGGDFYLYFDNGDPQVAIRTNDGEIAEVRGRGPSQNITSPKYDIEAEKFIVGNDGPTGGNEYLYDRNFRKMAVELMKTGKLPEDGYKYYDQYGSFMAPKPKMSYSNTFEKEYTDAFNQYEFANDEIFNDSTKTLNTSFRYTEEGQGNELIKYIKGDIIGTTGIERLGREYPVNMPLLESVNGGIILNSANTLILPKLKSVDFIFARNAIDVDIKSLEECKAIQLDQAISLIAPKLKEVSRVIQADEATQVDLRGLKKAGSIRLNQLMDKAKVVDLRNLEESESVDINIGYGGSLNLPKLKKAKFVYLQTGNETIGKNYGGEVYVPKLEVPENIKINTEVLQSTKDVFMAKAQRMPRPEKFTWIDSETGKTYKMLSGADFADVTRAFMGQEIMTPMGVMTPEELLKIYEMDSQKDRDKAMGMSFMPAREKERTERIPASGAELTASLVASGTSLESFGKGTLIQLAESYGIELPKDAKRGEIIDAINGRQNTQKQEAEVPTTPTPQPPTGAQFTPDYTSTYPTSEKGFYSQLQKTIDEKMPNKASVQQIMAIVDPTKGSGVKPEEIKWSNLEGFLEGKSSVTKQEVSDYLKNEGQIQFEEKYLAVEKNKTEEEIINEYTPEYIREQLQNWREVEMAPNDSFDDELENPKADKKQLLKLAKDYADSLDMTLGEFFDTTDAQNTPNARPTAINDPKYGTYVTPDGQNYREVVMTMPSFESKIKRLKELQNLPRTEENIAEFNRLSKETKPPNWTSEYTDSHFPDIPNYVAHMRLNERKDAEGNDGLFIEELQSGRHQKGRKQGYQGESEGMKTALAKAGLTMKSDGWNSAAIDKEGYEVVPDVANMTGERPLSSKGFRKATPEEASALDEARKFPIGTTPDAPFRKDWPVQLFKRALRDAIAGEKDWVGWTKGIDQVNRYENSIRQSVDSIEWTKSSDGTTLVNAIKRGESTFAGRVGTDGKFTSTHPEVGGKTLDEVIGKGMAEKIMSGGDTGTLKGKDLTIGGEGMKGFYDQILPKEIGKYVEKKFKGKVEQSEIVTGERYADPLHDIPQEAQDRIFNQVEKQLEKEGIFEDDENVDQDEYRDLFMERQRDLSEEWAKANSKGTKTYKIWKVKITPEMREAIQTEGQPQFTPEAATPQPSATSATKTLENVRLLTNSFNAGNGGILKNIKLIVPDNKKKLPLQELMINR